MIRALLVCIALAFGGLSVASAVAQAEPPHTHEILYNRPSGFWTSNRPAIGGAYRYRLLGIGVVIAAGMGYALVKIIRKAERERAGRG
jgi:hypothetical protein